MESKKNKGMSIFARIMLFINICCIAGLLMVYVAARVNPQQFPLLSFFPLGYTYLLIVNVLFVLWWAIKKRYLAFLSVAAILLGISFIPRYAQVNSHHFDEEQLLKIMSFNTQVFNVYVADNRNQAPGMDSIFATFQQEQPDILCLQEYYLEDPPHQVDIHKKLRDALGDVYIDDSQVINGGRYSRFGVATVSRHPVVGSGLVFRSSRGSNSGIYTDLLIGNDTVRVYNVHFESIRLNASDYASLPASEQNEGQLKQNLKRISKKVYQAARLRGAQVAAICDHIATCPYEKVILCGDFNDVPASYAYQQLHNLLIDSFTESGNGLGLSYAGKVIPAFRIDYIFHSDAFQSKTYRTLKALKVSDHYPIVSCLK